MKKNSVPRCKQTLILHTYFAEQISSPPQSYEATKWRGNSYVFAN